MEAKFFVLLFVAGSFVGIKVKGEFCRVPLVCNYGNYTKLIWGNLNIDEMGDDAKAVEEFLDDVRDLKKKVSLLNDQFGIFRGESNAEKDETPSIANSVTSVWNINSVSSREKPTTPATTYSVTMFKNTGSTTYHEAENQTITTATAISDTTDKNSDSATRKTGHPTTPATTYSEAIFEGTDSTTTQEAKEPTTFGAVSSDITDRLPCEEGFRHGSKCYFVIIPGDSYPTLAEAQNLCSAKGGIPADILNLEHQQFVADHVRSVTSGTTWLWLGMSYTYSTGTLRWSTGIKVPEDVADSIRWWSGARYSSSSYDKIALGVTSNTFGIFNHPSTTNYNGVVCEK